MAFQSTPYTVPLVLAALLSGAVALYAGWAYRRREVERRSVGLFALAMVAVAFWSGTYAIQLSSVSLSAKVYWVRWTNTATFVAPTTWLLFALAYADHEEWLTPGIYGLLLVEPVVGFVANWTTALGGLMWQDFGRVQPSSFYLLDRTLGPLFVAHAVYSYLLVLLGGALIVAKVHRSSRMYRAQAALLVGGTALPLLTNVGYVMGLGPEHVNLTPVAFAGTGLAFAVAIFYYDLLDVIPVARNAVIESMHEGYLVTDETERVVDSNPAARVLLDASGEPIVGRPARDVFPAAEGLSTSRELETEGKARTEITTPANGDRRHLDVTATALRHDEHVGTLFVLRDITERVEREQALERTNERLERFAGIVSHDLRNPLNVAEGYVELLEDDGEAVDAIQESHERMQRIIEDVLTLAREGAEVSDREPVRLGSLAEDAWEFVDTKDATLRVEGDGTIRADESRLSRALENLFRNAVEHGRNDVTITVGRIGDDGPDGPDVTDAEGFYVADDGPGLPDEVADSPFEMGVTGAADGTGFGLAIVADVVDAHGWEISAGESEDGGARFDVTGVEVR